MSALHPGDVDNDVPIEGPAITSPDERRFATLDVFTDKAFTGNPLAVVLEPEGLDAATMLAIAAEFNLSETVFVLPPRDRSSRAGATVHACARTAFRRPSDGRDRRPAAQPDGGGSARSCSRKGRPRPVLRAIDRHEPRPRAVRPAELPVNEADGPPAEDRDRGIGLKPDDLRLDHLGPSPLFGRQRVLVCSRSRPGGDGAVRGRRSCLEEVFGSGGPGAAFLFAARPGCRDAFHARMFAPASASEDRATGSAVARSQASRPQADTPTARTPYASSRATKWAGRVCSS